MRWLAFNLLMALALNVGAATYYVDFDAGADSNAGTSTGAPFKYAPGDRDATSTAAATTLAAGDTVVYKGGVTHVSKRGSFYTSIGTAGTPITFDLTGTSFGTGQAILTTTNAPIFCVAFTNCTDIVWKGGMITNVAGYREDDPVWTAGVPITSAPDGVGLYFYRSTNITVAGAQFSEIGQWQNTAPMDGNGSVTGYGVNLRGCSNAVVAFCEFTRQRSAVVSKADTLSADINIVSNNFHNYMAWIVDVNPVSGGHTARVNIKYNEFGDCREYDNNNWTGTGDSPHGDKVFIRTSGISSTWTNVVVSHNWFYDDDVAADGGSGQIHISQGPSVDVYANIFTGRAAQGQLYLNDQKAPVTYQKVRVFNNTFYGGSRAISAADIFNPDVLVLANNALARNTTVSSRTVLNMRTNALWQTADSFADYNLVFSLLTPLASWEPYYTGGFRTIASWRGYSLMDSNTILDDPDFVYTSGLPSTWDLHPLATSPLNDAGTNLTAIVGSGLTDYDGNALPSGTTPWPIGAFGSTNAFTVAPEILTATVDSTGTNWSFGGNQTLFVGSGGDGGFSASLTLGSMTFTYAGGSGTDTLSYTGNRVTYAGETGSLSYTQPGNGIEDSDGDDLATFSGLAIVNNSSQQQPAPSGSARSLVKFKGLTLGRAVGIPLESSYVWKQDFEGTGYDNGQTWTESGSGILNEDYTSTVLAGSQSMNIDLTSNIGAAYGPLHTLVESPTIHYAYFQLRVISFPSSSFRIFTISNVLDVSISATSNLTVRPAVGTSVATVGMLEAGVTYHVWTSGSGQGVETANATARVAFSTDGIRPTSGDNYAIDTDAGGAAGQNPAQVVLGSLQVGADYNIILDKIRVNDVVIGDNPE